MCGISGIIGQRPTQDWRAWAQLTAYRGPDALDLWEQPDALLCHNRLSIIDLSTAANQPMVSEDKRYVVVFNGEIFNFQALRAELESKGRRFRTRSDTEVLLLGFIEWGEAVLERLDGMFAFAIWEPRTRKLFAARDHAGIKPFFYAAHQGRFVFGSEIKLLLHSGLVPRDVRSESVLAYLAYSYVPAPDTAYTHIRSLAPGEALWFDLARAEVTTRRWWSVPSPATPAQCGEAEAAQELVRLFSGAVQRRMIADVPLGAFLSGGVDSSVIVAEMARVSAQKVKTFAIGYRHNPEYDESVFAEEVAAHLGVDHETIYPDFASRDLDESLHLIVRQFDQPYGNATVLLTSILTHDVRNKVTVALVGDGGDELFGGYPRYWALGQQARWGGLIRLVRPALLAWMKLRPETPEGNHLARRLRRFLTSSHADLGLVFEESTRLFPRQSLHALVNPARQTMAAQQTLLQTLFNTAQGSWLTRACATDQASFLPFNLMEGADRMSMVNSFELRLPFLDRQLMEFAAALPPELKIQGKLQKRILKAAYRDVLPPTVLNRPKRGFNPPVWHWLKDNAALLETLLRKQSRLGDYVQMDAVRSMIQRFQSRREDNSTQLWSLLVLDRWLEQQI